jgi:hypothetical protein
MPRGGVNFLQTAPHCPRKDATERGASAAVSMSRPLTKSAKGSWQGGSSSQTVDYSPDDVKLTAERDEFKIVSRLVAVLVAGIATPPLPLQVSLDETKAFRGKTIDPNSTDRGHGIPVASCF